MIRATCSATAAKSCCGDDSRATSVATRRRAACSSASSRRWLSACFAAEMSRSAPQMRIGSASTLLNARAADEDRLGLDLAQRQLDRKFAAVRAHARQLHPASKQAPFAGLHEASGGG